MTYGNLLDRAELLAARIASEGLKPGDRIALLAKSDTAFVDLTMAASMAGLVLVPLNFRLALPEVDFIVQDAEAKLIFVGTEFLDVARKAQAAGKACRATIAITPDGTYGGWRSSTERVPAKQGDGSAVQFQMYTSGTTGHPKGVLLTHDNVFALCRNGIRYLGVHGEHSDRIGPELGHLGRERPMQVDGRGPRCSAMDTVRNYGESCLPIRMAVDRQAYCSVDLPTQGRSSICPDAPRGSVRANRVRWR